MITLVGVAILCACFVALPMLGDIVYYLYTQAQVVLEEPSNIAGSTLNAFAIMLAMPVAFASVNVWFVIKFS